jgi:AraC family transcriptional regulator
VVRLWFYEGAHFSATPRHHIVWFNMSSQTHFDCRIAGKRLRHDVLPGSLAVCPAGADCAADAESNVDALLVCVEPDQLALAAADDGVPEPQLIERLSGRDLSLLELARILLLESADGYPNEPLFWNQVARDFIVGLLARHSTARRLRPRGMLGSKSLARIKEHIRAHLDEPIDIAILASIANRSPFHFSRVFKRSVGMSPHRFVVHMRLERAAELVRARQGSLAEIAVRTGFADQSHLTRWARRVYGVPISRLAD